MSRLRAELQGAWDRHRHVQGFPGRHTHLQAVLLVRQRLVAAVCVLHACARIVLHALQGRGGEEGADNCSGCGWADCPTQSTP